VRRRYLAFLAAALVALALAACGGGSDEGTEAGAETAGAATSVATTTEETTPEPSEEGDVEAGAAVFETAGCGGCHTLAAAGSTGSVGPNLDELQPELDAIVEQVTNGGGAMPAFGGMLSDEEIRDVAAYVLQSTSGGG
jgi:mono/diheme cytochrome c family protein